MSERLYFRQLLSGVDFGAGDELARQMRNFVYLIGDAESREVVVVDPAYSVSGLIDMVESAGMKLTGVLATQRLRFCGF